MFRSKQKAQAMPALLRRDTFVSLREMPHGAFRLAVSLEIAAWDLGNRGRFNGFQMEQEIVKNRCSRYDLKVLVDAGWIKAINGKYHIVDYSLRHRGTERPRRAKRVQTPDTLISPVERADSNPAERRPPPDSPRLIRSASGGKRPANLTQAAQ